MQVSVGEILDDGSRELVQAFHKGLWDRNRAECKDQDKISAVFHSIAGCEQQTLDTSKFTRFLKSISTTGKAPKIDHILTVKGVVLWAGFGHQHGNKVALGKRLGIKFKNTLGKTEKTHRIKKTDIELPFIIKFMETPFEEFLAASDQSKNYQPVSCASLSDETLPNKAPGTDSMTRRGQARKRKDCAFQPCRMNILRIPGGDASAASLGIHNVALTAPVWVRQGSYPAQVLPIHILLVARIAGLHVVDMAKDEHRNKQLPLSLSWLESCQVNFWDWKSITDVLYTSGDPAKEDMDELRIKLADGTDLAFDCTDGCEITQNMDCLRKQFAVFADLEETESSDSVLCFSQTPSSQC